MDLKTLFHPLAARPLQFVAAGTADRAVTTVRHRLAARQVTRFDAPAVLHLCCLRGCLWITTDNDPCDQVCAAGDHFVAAAGRHVVVSAFEDASFVVRQVLQ